MHLHAPGQAGNGIDGLVLGDTEGRTPGAYGFIVSCDLAGYVGPLDSIMSATIMLTRSSLFGTNPLARAWTSNRGVGSVWRVCIARAWRACVWHV